MFSDGWLAILQPFQQYLSHIRMMGGWEWKVVRIGIPFQGRKDIYLQQKLNPGPEVMKNFHAQLSQAWNFSCS